MLRLAASARHLEGGHARARSEGWVRVRARQGRAECGVGRVRAEPGRVRAEQVLCRAMMPRQAVRRAGARVSTCVLRVCVP